MANILKRPEVAFVDGFKSYEDGELLCACGRKHSYGWGDSTCDCGQNYNAFGQCLTADARDIPDWCDTEEEVEAWRCSREEG